MPPSKCDSCEFNEYGRCARKTGSDQERKCSYTIFCKYYRPLYELRIKEVPEMEIKLEGELHVTKEPSEEAKKLAEMLKPKTASGFYGGYCQCRPESDEEKLEKAKDIFCSAMLMDVCIKVYEENEELKKQVEELEKMNKNQFDRITKLHDERDALQRKYDDLCTRKTYLACNMCSTVKELKDARDDFKNKYEKAGQEIDRLVELVHGYRDSVKGLNEEIAKLRLQGSYAVCTDCGTVEELMEKNAELEKEVERREKQINRMYANWRKEQHEKADRLNELQESLAKERERTECLEKLCESLKEQKDQMRVQIKDFETNIEVINGLHDEKIADMKQEYKGILRSKYEEIRALEADLEEIKKAKDALQAENLSLKQQICMPPTVHFVGSGTLEIVENDGDKTAKNSETEKEGKNEA